MSNHFLASVRCLEELDNLSNNDGEDADRLRCQMEFHWYRLSPQERKAITCHAERANTMSTITKTGVVSRQPHWSDKPLFWAVDFDSFVKLRKLHKWSYQDLHLEANAFRWQRKEPQNRKGECPDYYSKVHNGIRTKNLWDFVRACRAVRKPCETEAEALEIRQDFIAILSRIDEAYEDAVKFFGE